jgi:uncharacterized protein (TIGR02466 family)
MNTLAKQDNLADPSMATFELLFPSPVIFFDWPDSQALNEDLRNIILQKRDTTTGVVKTNRGGWQSDTNLQDWGDPATEQLLARILTLGKEYVARQIGRHDPAFESGWRIRAWANVNEKGHFNRTHHHLGRQSFFSGVYYVNVGDIEMGQASGGRTRFEDWTRVAIDTLQEADTLRRDYLMTPRNGRMLIFPASLMHSVEVYGGDTQRITIAFNLYHPGFGIPRLEEFIQQSDWWWANFRGLMIAKRKLPEKLFALTKIPGQLVARKVEDPLSFNAWCRHASTAIGHATALASEHFEAKRKNI